MRHTNIYILLGLKVAYIALEQNSVCFHWNGQIAHVHTKANRRQF